MRMHILLTGLFLALGAVPVPATSAEPVIINGEVLDRQTHDALESHYRTRLIPGRWWYDPVSGLWGAEGGPSLGQIVAGLRMGNALAADASVRNRWARTFVFVNGREIHARELMYLRGLFGNVSMGRYWMTANGVAGFEGGPPQFDLRSAAMARSRPAAQGGNGYGRRGAFGNTGSDGSAPTTTIRRAARAS